MSSPFPNAPAVASEPNAGAPAGTPDPSLGQRDDSRTGAVHRFVGWCRRNGIRTASLDTLAHYPCDDRSYLAVAAAIQRLAEDEEGDDPSKKKPTAGPAPSAPTGPSAPTSSRPGESQPRKDEEDASTAAPNNSTVAPGMAGGMAFDPSMIGEIVSPIATSIGEIGSGLASGLGGALSGLAGGFGGLGSGLGIHANLTYVADNDLLTKLRDLSADEVPPQHADSHNRQVRDVVEELRERGYDADQIVASVRHANDEDATIDLTPEAQEYVQVKDRQSNLHQAGGGFMEPGGPDFADHPFQGSGPDPKLWHTTSEDYVDDHEKSLRQDVTDLPDGDMVKYTKDRPAQGPKKARRVRRQSDLNNFDEQGNYVQLPAGDTIDVPMPDGAAGDYASPGGAQNRTAGDHSDIVAAFHAAGGGAAVQDSSASYSDDAIAKAAQCYLKTAGRVYSLAEQRELEEESHPLGARNRPTESELQGTHYV